MPVHTTTLKRQRQSRARRVRNQAIVSRLKTLIKKTRKAFETQDPKGMQDALTSTLSALSKAASKRIIHPNKASRTAARLSRRHRKLASLSSSGEKTGSTPKTAS